MFIQFNTKIHLWSLTNLWSKLALWISGSARLLINELDKVIQVPATIIIFTSFVSLREELQCGETRNTIPENMIYYFSAVFMGEMIIAKPITGLGIVSANSP
jgi:hypothetical protein